MLYSGSRCSCAGLRLSGLWLRHSSSGRGEPERIPKLDGSVHTVKHRHLIHILPAKAEVKELSGLAFVAEATNILMLGPPGVGRTHLAVALALRAIERGYGAHFARACDLMEDLRKARAEHNLDRRLRVCPAPKALLVY